MGSSLISSDTECGLLMALESLLPAASDAFIYGRGIHSRRSEAFKDATSRKLANDIAFAKRMTAKARSGGSDGTY